MLEIITVIIVTSVDLGTTIFGPEKYIWLTTAFPDRTSQEESDLSFILIVHITNFRLNPMERCQANLTGFTKCTAKGLLEDSEWAKSLDSACLLKVYFD